MRRKPTRLQSLCDSVLLATMPSSLRSLIHDLVGKGWSKREIMAAVGRAGAVHGTFTRLMIEAAIEEATRVAN